MESPENEDFMGMFRKSFGSDEDARAALELVRTACRKSGMEEKSYISHNTSVAKEVMWLGLGRKIAIAALVHNVVEHGVRPAEVERVFGKEVLDIVDAKMRFEKALEFGNTDQGSAEKKLMIVLTTNPEVVMLQLGEVIDKIRNVDKIVEMERKGFVAEVRRAYAPLAHKLGMYSMSSELNDLAFKFEHPKTYMEIRSAVDKLIEKCHGSMEKWQGMIAKGVTEAGIEASLTGRIKTVYSIYAKMKRKNAGLGRIYDIVALRLVTESVRECYEVLGILHSMWKPIPGEFDDYIVKPKENGYRSLHTSMFTEEGFPIEVQIRTKEMNDFAELGMASHWQYKGEKKEAKHDRKIEWIKQVLDWQRSTGANTQMDIFGKEIFAMTPKGQVIELPDGASIIDFAYAVHSDIGDKCNGARINGMMVPLGAPIKNGDVVEIVTSEKRKPQMSWLSLAKTAKAKQKIMAKLGMKTEDSKAALKKKPAGEYVKTSNAKVRLAKCCSPLPGDAIVGVKTTKRKISVHQINCIEASKLGTKVVRVEWAEKPGEYDAEIVVETADRIGILKDVLGVFSENGIYVASTNAKATQSNTTTCIFGVRLRSLKQLEELTMKISRVKGVIKVHRYTATA
ncbi:MAG: bifunctional (p)ppGpp synthetase/guanosine-3',5'-bis(diphosphate) 3'-pyrophosphohydrolase [Candidatus Diapherotrites archaeon]|uniref:Bifunctional (P)ppGpp synthetase/guanosine-3',5'-bis(Diphosphate) 3'-pyrophosphohydrolase n=1 Tax=Candidatus Iainarchaeum sp. TaxID=3101447 RepID=A0A8T3YIQ5_9ARCH|nr:bifunctional (p)ppGpp synthetase/guanosine-3',5'-bis(diphosphate) 3'-pyrophosphohydrolase [Candidatus Diapherotrites archaeon]